MGLSANNAQTEFTLRRATLADRPNLELLIAESVRGLSREDYTQTQIEAALDTAFGVDSELIRDGTYFAAEAGGALVGCGGWSRRRTLLGGDRQAGRASELLDPVHDAAAYAPSSSGRTGRAAASAGRCSRAARRKPSQKGSRRRSCWRPCRDSASTAPSDTSARRLSSTPCPGVSSSPSCRCRSGCRLVSLHCLSNRRAPGVGRNKRSALRRMRKTQPYCGLRFANPPYARERAGVV